MLNRRVNEIEGGAGRGKCLTGTRESHRGALAAAASPFIEIRNSVMPGVETGRLPGPPASRLMPHTFRRDRGLDSDLDLDLDLDLDVDLDMEGLSSAPLSLGNQRTCTATSSTSKSTSRSRSKSKSQSRDLHENM
jgi:hypothetical protein